MHSPQPHRNSEAEDEEQEEMMKNGSFSYKDTNKGDNRFQNTLATGTHKEFIRIVRISMDTAAIQCYASDTCEPASWIELSLRYSLVRLSDTGAGGVQENRHRGDFIINWANSYELYYDGKLILKLSNQRQQSRDINKNVMIPVPGYPEKTKKNLLPDWDIMDRTPK